MKKSLFIVLLTSFFFSCVPEDHVLEIEIQNNTSERITDVKVFTAGERVTFEVDALPAGQQIDHTTQIPGNSADGQFIFQFSRSNGEQESATGNYLENGEGSLKKTLVFDVQEQGVNVEQKSLEVE